jgi:hypothetical protein
VYHTHDSFGNRVNHTTEQLRQVEFRQIIRAKREKAAALIRDAMSTTSPRKTNSSAVSDRLSSSTRRRPALRHSPSTAHLHGKAVEQLRVQHSRKVFESKTLRQWLFPTLEHEDRAYNYADAPEDDAFDDQDTDFSEYCIDPEVVLALIHANPNAVNRRCNRRVVHLRMHTVLAAQGRSLSRKQSSRQREKVFLSRWAKSRRDVNKVAAEEAGAKAGQLPLELYITYTPAQLISSRVLALLMGCIDMKTLFDIDIRPQSDAELTALSISQDRFGLEKWVEGFLLHGLAPDQLRMLELDDDWTKKVGKGELIQRLRALRKAEEAQASEKETPAIPQFVVELSMSGIDMETASAVALHFVHDVGLTSWSDLLDGGAREVRESSAGGSTKEARQRSSLSLHGILHGAETKWLRTVLSSSRNSERKLQLHEDDIRLICEHISMMKLTRTIFRSHAAYLLTCVPMSSPKQYGLSASEGVVLQARIFAALTEYVAKRNKSTIAFRTQTDVFAEYVCEFALDENILSELQQSGMCVYPNTRGTF